MTYWTIKKSKMVMIVLFCPFHCDNFPALKLIFPLMNMHYTFYTFNDMQTMYVLTILSLHI